MNRRIGPWIVADLVVFVFALFPVFWLAMLSLKDPATISDGRLIPSKWSTESYSSIFSSNEFTRALINSIGIALISTVLAVLLASMAAYAIARLEFPGKRVIPGASTFQVPTGAIAAAAIVVTVPIIVMVLFFQRRIVAGLTAGAVKG